MAKSLEKWIAEALDDADKTPSQCTCLTLMHFRGPQGSQSEIHSIKLLTGKAYTAKGLAEIFNGKMETDAQGMVGAQQYVLLAFYSSDAPGARFPMTFIGEGGLDYKGMATEGPSRDGQTSQAMRLTERLVQGAFNMMSQNYSMLTQLNRSLAQDLKDAQETARDATKIILDVAKAQVQATHEMKMKEAEYARSSQERKGLIALVPPLVNRLTGQEVFPQATEDTALVETFCENMDREKLEMLSMVPNMDKKFLALLTARFEAHEKKKTEEKERIAQLRPGDVEQELGPAAKAALVKATGGDSTITEAEIVEAEPIFEEVH